MDNEDKGAVSAAETANRLQQHFWITLTAIGVHAFLMSDLVVQRQSWRAILFVAGLVWFLATYNIVEIAGEPNVTKPSPPKKDDRKKFGTAGWETLISCRLFYKRVWFIAVEFKGAILYAILVFLSFCGVFAVSPFCWCWPFVCLGFAIVSSCIFDRTAKSWWIEDQPQNEK